MKKILLIPILLLFLVGAGCTNSQQKIVEEQQKQIDSLTKSLQISESSTQSLQEQVDSLNNKKTVNASNDPQIKIEKCKAQAKDYADKIAVRLYLQAFEKAQAQGDTASAQMYLQFSEVPEHPADYDSNYQGEYIKCLSN